MFNPPYLDGDPIPGRFTPKTANRLFGYEHGAAFDGGLALAGVVAGNDSEATPGSFHFWYESAYLLLGVYTTPPLHGQSITMLELTLPAVIQLEYFVAPLRDRRALTDTDNWYLELSLNFFVPSLTSTRGRSVTDYVFFKSHNGPLLDRPDPIHREMRLRIETFPGDQLAAFVSATMKLGFYGDAPLIVAFNASQFGMIPDPGIDFAGPSFITFPYLRIDACSVFDPSRLRK